MTERPFRAERVARMLGTVLGVLLLAASTGWAVEPFVVEVVDDETGRGVPLVRLRTVHDVSYWTDSQGLVAVDDPDLLHQEAFFSVWSHGYTYPADGFGFRGKRLTVEPGGHATLQVHRVNLAERLYRVTGAGIYHHSVRAGREVPLEQPLISGLVVGCDSVLTAVYRNRVYWFWGDTNRPGHPLGNFKVSGATSLLPADGGLSPDVGVDLHYFVAGSGFAKKMAPLASPGPTWLSGPVVLQDGSGRERLFAAYVNIHGGDRPLEVAEQGIVEFDDEAEEFVAVVEFPLGGPFPHGSHALVHDDEGEKYVYFADPFPMIRVPATPEALVDFPRYEAFTCLEPGSRFSDRRLDRDTDGRLRWGWKADTDRIRPVEEARLVREGRLDEKERRWGLADRQSGAAVVAQRGSVAWNDYRRRWIMILNQQSGTSPLGEIWYAEARDLEGPWGGVRKIVTHDRYSFYNVQHHPFFDRHGGRVIYFEGTYTTTFSGNPDPTPRYNYNQIMYRLDLDRLAQPPAETSE